MWCREYQDAAKRLSTTTTTTPSVSPRQQNQQTSTAKTTAFITQGESSSLQTELEEKMVSDPTGRLRHFIENWKQITSDNTILDWVEGVKIPFLKKPVQKYIVKNPNWSDKEIAQIKEHIAILLKKEAIRKCSSDKDQFISNIFLIPKRYDLSRLILN